MREVQAPTRRGFAEPVIPNTQRTLPFERIRHTAVAPCFRSRTRTHRALALVALVASLSAAPSLSFRTQSSSASSNLGALGDLTGGFNCGYDPRGAIDGWHLNQEHLFRMAEQRQVGNGVSQPSSRGPVVRDFGDVSVIEDDGSIVIQEARFDLSNSSLLFNPDGDGYGLTRTDSFFMADFGYELDVFVSAGLAFNRNNGYRELTLVPEFDFFGRSYQSIFIGTNGYVTFEEGDTSALPSPSALAHHLPRIAPLWADLNATSKGAIYYNRLSGFHLVSWVGLPGAESSGTSTFQLALYDDGRFAFAYKKVKARASLVGISPGHWEGAVTPLDLSRANVGRIAGPVFETFAKKKRVDLPALTRAFYETHPDEFDTIYSWTDFGFDNGLGIAHAFNVRNDVSGIGLPIFDRSTIYGSQSRLSSILMMGDIVRDWPADPQAQGSGLFSAVAILAHELGHRWLAHVRFDADHDIKDDLLGRDLSHWSFLADTRTNEEGTFSSVMEGNAWKDNGNGSFITSQTAANYFSPLDQYLMGLLPASEVAKVPYLVVDKGFQELVRSRSPVSGFLMAADRKIASVPQIVEREGPRLPEFATAPKSFRIAFVLLVERGATPLQSTISAVDRYRGALVRYFSNATGRRGSLDSSLSGS